MPPQKRRQKLECYKSQDHKSYTKYVQLMNIEKYFHPAKEKKIMK